MEAPISPDQSPDIKTVTETSNIRVGQKHPDEYTQDPTAFIRTSFLKHGETPSLYHVTTNKSRVLQEGLKSRKEIGLTGLGGGTTDMDPNLVSVTYSRDRAEDIFARLRLAVSAARNEVSASHIVRQMMKEFVVYDSTPEVIARVLDAPHSEYKDWAAFVAWIDKKFTSGDSKYGFVSQLDLRLPSLFRENVTKSSPRVPYSVGLTGTAEELARLNPDEIAILDIAARKSAQPFQDGFEAELRFKPQDVFVVISEYAPLPKLTFTPVAEAVDAASLKPNAAAPLLNRIKSFLPRKPNRSI
jgi:hypothetical protein